MPGDATGGGDAHELDDRDGRGRAGPFDEVWRPGLASQVTGWVGVGLNALLVVVALASVAGGDGGVGTSLLVAAVCAVVALAIWRWTVHPLLAVSAAGITVRNPLRSYVVAWEDVVAVAPTSLGLAMKLRGGGRPLVAWAVTKSNVAIRLGRRSRADEVAEYVVGRTTARSARRPGPPDPPAGS